jgi:phosphonopyruvate decarboxylase
MSGRMNMRLAVAAVHAARSGDDVVISSMGTAREWMAMGPLHPRDFVYVPSAMGHGTSLGLGLALAQPKRRIIAMVGDGSLLMNLGSLATIAAQRPENLVTLVFDNGVYEITGAQPTPATVGAERSRVDFVAAARACGIAAVHFFDEIDAWRAGIDGVLAARGPTVAVLAVAPVPGAMGPKSPGPTSGRGTAFMAALRG